MASSCVPATHWEDAGAVLGPGGGPRAAGPAPRPGPGRGDGHPGPARRRARRAGEGAGGPGGPGRGRRPCPGAVGPRADRLRRRRDPLRPRIDHRGGGPRQGRRWGCSSRSARVRAPRTSPRCSPSWPTASSTSRGAWPPTTSSPNDLRRHGHLDGLLRRLVAGGVAPAVAVRHASYVPARHYGLIDRGALAPGYRADIVLVEDLQDFRVRTVIKDGRIAARDGRCLDRRPRAPARSREHGPPAPARRGGVPPAAGGRDLPGDRDRPRPDRHPAHVAERPPGRRPLGVRPGARRRC